MGCEILQPAKIRGMRNFAACENSPNANFRTATVLLIPCSLFCLLVIYNNNIIIIISIYYKKILKI